MNLEPNEHQSQAAFVQWLKLKNIRHFAVPNSLKVGGVKLMSYLKAEGLTAGVPDMMIPYRRHLCGGLFIEMKAKKGRVKPEQTEWHEFLRSEGFRVVVCYSTEEAIEATTRYMKGGVER